VSVEAISWALNLARSRPIAVGSRLVRASPCSSANPHRRRSEPVCGTGRPALGCRIAPVARPVAALPAVVR